MSGYSPLTLSLGEVLWDVLPDGRELGGSPTNAAWNLRQLGADAHVASAVGDDALGRETLDLLRGKGLDIDATAIITGKPTSTVDAILGQDGNATYVIHENVAWDYLPAGTKQLELARRAAAINFGSLAQRGKQTRESTHAILDAASQDAIRVFDINLRPPFIDREVLASGFKRASVVKLNNDELQQLGVLFNWSDDDERIVANLFGSYPNVKHVVVTRGKDGGWWCTPSRLYRQQPQLKGKIVDTIGAGDSVTSVVMMGLLLGWEADKILHSAIAIASFVCTQRGGMPVLPEELTRPFHAALERR